MRITPLVSKCLLADRLRKRHSGEASVPSLQNRRAVHFSPVDLPVIFIPDDDGMAPFKKFRLMLNESVGDFVRHHLGVGFISTLARFSASDELMIFQIEAIKRHGNAIWRAEVGSTSDH